MIVNISIITIVSVVLNILLIAQFIYKNNEYNDKLFELQCENELLEYELRMTKSQVLLYDRETFAIDKEVDHE